MVLASAKSIRYSGISENSMVTKEDSKRDRHSLESLIRDKFHDLLIFVALNVES